MARITPNQAIRNAVEAELAASRFYRLLGESTDDPAAAGFLFELAELEQQHARSIEQEGEKLVTGPIAERADSPVEMVETLPEWRFAEGLTYAQALGVAYEAELQASMYYDAFADNLEGQPAAFFRALAKTEEEHAKAVEERRKAL